jgi:hypothetical protein
MIVNVIPGGSESGALPILDSRRAEVENREVCVWHGVAKAGTKKAGTVTSLDNGAENMVRKAPDERAHPRIDAIGGWRARGFVYLWSSIRSSRRLHRAGLRMSEHSPRPERKA